MYFRHQNADAKSVKPPMSSIRAWKRKHLNLKSKKWTSVRALGENLKENPISLGDGFLTAEVIELEGETDPIVAIFSEELLLDVERNTANIKVPLNADGTFRALPAAIFAKENKKSRQLYTVLA